MLDIIAKTISSVSIFLTGFSVGLLLETTRTACGLILGNNLSMRYLVDPKCEHTMGMLLTTKCQSLR